MVVNTFIFDYDRDVFVPILIRSWVETIHDALMGSLALMHLCNSDGWLLAIQQFAARERNFDVLILDG